MALYTETITSSGQSLTGYILDTVSDPKYMGYINMPFQKVRFN